MMDIATEFLLLMKVAMGNSNGSVSHLIQIPEDYELLFNRLMAVHWVMWFNP
jgi:hypothetical protein